jgi:hypothetical protein
LCLGLPQGVNWLFIQGRGIGGTRLTTYTSSMPNRSRKKKQADPVQLARRIVDQATGVSTPKKAVKPAKATTKKDAADIERAAGEGMAQPQGIIPRKRPKKKPVDKRDPAAVALGRKGGLKGGKARAAKLTKEQLSESAREAAKARWADRDA